MSVTHKVAFSIEPALRPFLPRISYVLDFLSAHPNAPLGGVRWLLTEQPVADMICVGYGRVPRPTGFHVPAQHLIFRHLLPAVASLAPKCYKFGDLTLFSVENSVTTGTAEALFFRSNADIAVHFGFDWIETLFFHLSRLEEYQAGLHHLDEHGILSSGRQFLPAHRLHHRPVVDHLVNAIYRAIGLAPQEHPTSWTVTHDIDHLRLFSPAFKLGRYLGGITKRHRSLRGLLPLLKCYRDCRWRGTTDPYLSFEWLFARPNHLERIIYLAAVQRPHVLDPSYGLDEPRIREAWDLAADLGYDLGLHPSYQTWRNADLLQAELDRLQQWSGRPIKHTRQHYLRFAFPDTPDIIEQSGLSEDSTLGYRDRIGFRCGTGFAYHLYNFTREKKYTWLEKPLVVMDIALLREAVFHPAALTELWTRFTQANQRGTHITVNFHNSVFFEPELHGLPLRNLYHTLVDDLDVTSELSPPINFSLLFSLHP